MKLLKPMVLGLASRTATPVAMGASFRTWRSATTAVTVSGPTAETDLKANLASDTTIDLGSDIALTTTIEITSGQTGLVLNGNDFTVDGGGTVRCLYLTSEASNLATEVTLSRITFANGYSDEHDTLCCSQSPSDLRGYGGGLYVWGNMVSLHMVACVVSSSTAGSKTTGEWAHGGGLYAFAAALTIEDCKFEANVAATKDGHHCYGAGVMFEDSFVTMDRCVITKNECGDPETMCEGGGMTVMGGHVTLNGCTVSHNVASKVYQCKGFEPPLFSSIDCNNDRGSGGGIYSNSANTKLNDCLVFRNSGSQLGGGLFGPMHLNGTIVSENRARDGGGWVLPSYNGANGYSLSRSTITGNVAALGSAMVVNHNLVIVDSSISNNRGVGNAMYAAAVRFEKGVFSGTNIFMENNTVAAVSGFPLLGDFCGPSSESAVIKSGCRSGSHGNCSSPLAAAGQVSVRLPDAVINCVCVPVSCPPGKALPGGLTETFPSDCAACGTGQASLGGMTPCASCAVGRYASVDPGEDGGGQLAQVTSGGSTCNSCPRGHYADTSSTIVCKECGAGTISTTGASACSSCPPGKKSSEDKTQCVDCPEGTFNVAPGLSVCADCPVGSVASAVGSTACAPCDVGRHQGATGQAACEACEAGKVAAEAGLGVCDFCPSPTYSPAGASSCAQCVSGFYYSLLETCVSCPKGTLCAADGGSTQTHLTLQEGYWRLFATSVDVFACPLPGSCAGGDAVSRRQLLSSTFGDKYCATGYMGPLCAVCDTDGGFYFDPDTSACYACSSSFRPSPTLLLLVVLSVLPLIAGAVFALAKITKTFPGGNYSKRIENVTRKKERSQAGLTSLANAMGAVGHSAGPLKTNADGSVSFEQNLEVTPPPMVTLMQTKTATVAAKVSVVTKTSTQAVVTTTIETTIKPSGYVMAAIASIRAMHVKLKALTAFGQITVNIGFNCQVSFPALFERILDACKVLNLDVVPSLGLQCAYSGFNYYGLLLTTTLAPIACAAILGLGYWRTTARSNAAAAVKAELEARASSYVVEKAPGRQCPDGDPGAGGGEAAVVSKFSAEELLTLRRMFATADLDGSGFIDAREFSTLLMQLDPDASAEDVNAMFLEASGTGDSSDRTTISFLNFLETTHEARRPRRSSSLNERPARFATLELKLEAAVQNHPGKEFISAFLLLTFLVLISTSTTLLHFLKCREFDAGDGDVELYLFKDYSVDCQSPAYAAFYAYAIAMILVFPVGIPLTYGTLLWRHRATLSDPSALASEVSKGSPATGHLAFLVEAYKPEYYWFEVLECARRLLLASIVGIVSPEASAAPVLGILLSLGFAWAFTEMKPFKKAEDCALGVVLSHALVLFFLAALMIKLDASPEDPGDQRVFGALLVGILGCGPCAICFQLYGGTTLYGLRMVREWACSGGEGANKKAAKQQAATAALFEAAGGVSRTSKTSLQAQRSASVDRPPSSFRPSPCQET